MAALVLSENNSYYAGHNKTQSAYYLGQVEPRSSTDGTQSAT